MGDPKKKMGDAIKCDKCGGPHLTSNHPTMGDAGKGKSTDPESGKMKQMKGDANGKNWIAGAIKKPGALHKELGVPIGEKIPAKKLDKAEKAGGVEGKRARLAKTLRGFRK
jgi:hypothetical protein